MSRIGTHPIPLPAKVEVTLAAGSITVKGPLGSLTRTFGDNVSIEKDGDTLVCKAANEAAGPMHGTLRALVANMVKGVTAGYEKKLTLVGVGFRAQAAGDKVLASASTVEADVRKDVKNGGNKAAAAVVGKRIAERAKALGIESVAFDRSGFRYHGRVQALADAAREHGLKF